MKIRTLVSLNITSVSLNNVSQLAHLGLALRVELVTLFSQKMSTAVCSQHFRHFTPSLHFTPGLQSAFYPARSAIPSPVRSSSQTAFLHLLDPALRLLIIQFRPVLSLKNW